MQKALPYLCRMNKFLPLTEREKNSRIIFMGTPEFAVASLNAIVKAELNVVAVVTAPDKPAGRGMKLTESAVKKYAVANAIPVLQPVKLKSPEFIDELASYKADLQVVVAFRMLPEMVWSMPPLGTINLHGSLLPQYRGAAPINWAVINGEKETGVTTFILQHAIDTGNILQQQKFVIMPDDTAGDVHDRMMFIGADVLVDTIRGLLNHTLTAKPQEVNAGPELKHAPKIFTETCEINWNKPVTEIHNLIRGLSPYPGAFTRWGDKTLKLFHTTIVPGQPDITPGKFKTDGKTWLHIAAADGYINVEDLQLEGKKRMQVADFLRGYGSKITAEERLN